MAATMNGGAGAWSYAVPLEETDGNARHYPSHSQRDSHWDENENANANGNAAKPTLEKRNSAWDLQSDSETTKQRRTSMRQSNSNAVRKRSKNQLREMKTVPEPRRSDYGDDSAWIHRDKLAQIEIQEMAEAGIYVRPSRRSQSLGPGRENGRTSRSASRSGARRSTTDQVHEVGYDDDYAAAYPGNNAIAANHNGDYDREYMSMARVASPVASPHEEPPPPSPQRRLPECDPSRDSELRSVEEVAAEQNRYDRLQQQPHQQQYMGRPSTSRIPVSRISPVPVPQNVVGRDSPLPRSRAGSTSVSNSWDDMQYARKARSGSVSSQVLLDSDPEGLKITPPGSSNKHSSGEGSPSKARVPKKTPTGRKSSIPSATGRPGSSAGKRAPSGSASKRPGSSSGHKSRPSTGHFPPEGEAPWIATMYKPDPRLPPDQQMLPTHAKRMMQEQWEKEGKTGTVYDKDFNLLNDEEPKPKAPVLSLQSQGFEDQHTPRVPSPSKSLSPNGLSPNGSANGNGWPLSPKSDSGSGRPGTSGGYKITPTIPSTPTIQRSNAPSPAPPQPLNNPPHNPTPRIPDLDEKQEAAPKKGCCCVVM